MAESEELLREIRDLLKEQSQRSERSLRLQEEALDRQRIALEQQQQGLNMSAGMVSRHKATLIVVGVVFLVLLLPIMFLGVAGSFLK